MGHEFIGECVTSGEDSELDNYEIELAIKYIKQVCGQPPLGADVQITWEDHELGSYPVIAVVWDDYTTAYPDEYIGKCIEAFERFDLPEEIHRKGSDRARLFHDLHDGLQKLFDPD